MIAPTPTLTWAIPAQTVRPVASLGIVANSTVRAGHSDKFGFFENTVAFILSAILVLKYLVAFLKFFRKRNSTESVDQEISEKAFLMDIEAGEKPGS